MSVEHQAGPTCRQYNSHRLYEQEEHDEVGVSHRIDQSGV